ncbi:MAG: tryptophan--tRNA ligase [Candidatus Omnitrophica bacterium]|nr:tryptophan--tRNA ligase [Candidatus Omnitrophota bacterium]
MKTAKIPTRGAKEKDKRLLSGMRPTGPMHLGHLFGVLENWNTLQQSYDCFFMIADWHALMSEYQDPSKISPSIIEMAADWFAAGIDPARSSVFVQSKVKEHLDFFMIFSAMTPLSWLERCPTYKEQLRQIKGRDLTTYGFLGYPVLQAADILAYAAGVVPIGLDQMPHLELTREIARRFNGMYEQVFPEPEALLTHTPKFLGTDNRKMSKSYDNFISLGDSDDSIARKVSSMITDPERVRFSDKGRPGVCNVFNYFKFISRGMESDVRAWCENATTGCTVCKKKLSDIVIEFIRPHRRRREGFLKDKSYIENALAEGARKASDITARTLQKTLKAMKLYDV